MENKKKLKFNGMDFFIVILIAAIVAAGAYFLVGSDGGSTASSENVTVRAVVEITGKDYGYEDSIIVGDTVMIGEKDKMTASIENVEVNPAKTSGYNIIDGEVLRAEVPNLNDIQVTFTAEAAETDKAIEINGTPIRVGQHIAMFGNGWSSAGYVIGLETAAK